MIPGGSSGFYQRDGYTFDVGSSVMFGFSDKVSYLFNFGACDSFSVIIYFNFISLVM